ncbi:hypothetical protein M0D69_04110 [Caballeronia sp. SEWSISQ10-4 2]|uniref:hypothetical protein n=1 Tax=Caballeronia sp. SEWSISQ10-4 2 TaxID=2937438 RepID=UPI00264EB821|nr:hypothetical protein [Caballeronia sp. SEWSISQ10-4 2]MDN7177206.1 hypothetical protein [Caballeronia sp. SEWSISQ10-4 2]
MNYAASDTDLSTTTNNEDGSTTTRFFPDGTTRVDYPDGSSMTAYPDNRVLNVSPDGTRTLTDVNGVALDPDTGKPLGSSPPVVEKSPVSEKDLETGAHFISTLLEAAAIVADAETMLVFVEPINAVAMPVAMAIEVWRALEASVRAYSTMAYCYGLMYGALDMGKPKYPEGAYSLDSAETIRDKQAAFEDGIAKASAHLSNGSAGVALRNHVLIRTAFLNSDPHATLNEIWKVLCESEGDDFYAKQFALRWPETGMTEA